MNTEENCSKRDKNTPPVSPHVTTIDKMEIDTNVKLKENDLEKSKEIHNDTSIVKKVEMLLEAISSDEDIALDSEDSRSYEQDSESEVNFNDGSDDFNKPFIPSLFEANPLKCIQDPVLSIFELQRQLGENSKCIGTSDLVDHLKCLQLNNSDINENWVTIVEEIVQILPKTLNNILNIPEYHHQLFSLVDVTLDFHFAYKNHASMTTLVLRHLKVGLNLVEVLCQHSENLAGQLIKHHQVHVKLFNLYFAEHMCLSLKLNILRALDSSLNGSEPIRLFLYTEAFDKLNGYETLLKILGMQERPRVSFLLTSILRKIHFFELLQKMNSKINILDNSSLSLVNDCLSEITTTFIKAPILMGCPKRFLQARAQFELTPALTQSDVYPTIYRLFDDASLINRIIELFEISNESLRSLEHNLLNLLSSLMNYEHGLRYLGCRYKELNNLIKTLNKINSRFTLNVIYRMKVLSLIDYLSSFWECNILQNFKLDPMESVDVLHDMFQLTQSPIGKQAVVYVLTMGDNIDVIMNYFKYMEQTKSTSEELHMLYSLDLMKIILENSENVIYLKKYGPSLYGIACKHSCFNDLIDWTYPAMAQSAFFPDDVSELCNNVKNNVENCLNFNKTLITSLRILKYLAAPNDEIIFKSTEDFIELKHKYIILQMYSFDMLINLLMIVEKICDYYKQPSLNVWKLAGDIGTKILSIVHPTMVLIRCMLTLLIHSRENSFNDISPIKILLKLHSLMHSVIECSPTIREDATKIVKDIHKTLLTYVETKIGFSMINEVITWTLSSPSVFFPGMIMLCELLPLPLPIHSIKSLEDTSISTMTSYRNLWADHLSKINSNLVELVTIMGISNILLEPLKCLCVQIADLSPSLSLLITQTVLNALLDPYYADYFDKWLNLLSALCKHATIKSTVLQILYEKKSQENYQKLIQKICDKIKVNQQESAVSFMRCLCDAEIMVNSCYDEVMINNNVPDKLLFLEIIKAFISSTETLTDLSSLLVNLKTFLVIIKVDYGFYYFKTVLDLYPTTLYNIFKIISKKWNKEDNNCVSTLMLMVKLLISCVSNDSQFKRNLFISSSDLRYYLNWDSPSEDHPICTLREKMQSENHEFVTRLLECIELLNRNEGSTLEFTEPQLPIVNSLTTLYENRPFYILNKTKEDHVIISSNICDDITDLIECNVENVLLDMPDFNIKEKMKNLFSTDYCVVQSKPVILKEEQPIKKKCIETPSNSTVVVTPPTMNHKVFNRLGAVQRPDTFRNQSPNTSRPPSLHVDDFVAMETRNARQPRYKLPPVQPIQDLNITLRERQMAYERTYNLLNPYKSHLSMQSWHSQVNTLNHLRASYHQTISSRHLELQRQSLIAEWRQLRLEATLRKKRAYSRR
ncbi:protein virilizer-like [Adelges cooleyi]|uniref:protein virilizer-like n=1 Tax=Adelges cooleyi TaxID=133065 RepID=UPI0021806773|nr:protein virilizer-like [Adelges cooleyi]